MQEAENVAVLHGIRAIWEPLEHELEHASLEKLPASALHSNPGIPPYGFATTVYPHVSKRLTNENGVLRGSQTPPSGEG